MESRDWSSDVCSSDLFPSHDIRAGEILSGAEPTGTGYAKHAKQQKLSASTGLKHSGSYPARRLQSNPTRCSNVVQLRRSSSQQGMAGAYEQHKLPKGNERHGKSRLKSNTGVSAGRSKHTGRSAGHHRAEQHECAERRNTVGKYADNLRHNSKL